MFFLHIVNTGEVKIIERLGKYHKTLEPGFHITIPFIDMVRRTVSTKQSIIDVPPNNVITKDNVPASIDAVIFYKVIDPYKAVYNIENFKQAIATSGITNLRNLVGNMCLDDLLSKREEMNARLLAIIDKITDDYGIKIVSVEIKDIQPPRSIQEAMELQMTSERKKRAAILDAEGEKQSSITRAEGMKESAILKAQADKETTILNAEAQAREILEIANANAEAIITEAQAQAKAISNTLEAIKNSDVDPIAYKQVEALVEMSKNNANKIIIPNEMLSTFGQASLIGDAFKKGLDK